MRQRQLGHGYLKSAIALICGVVTLIPGGPTLAQLPALPPAAPASPAPQLPSPEPPAPEAAPEGTPAAPPDSVNTDERPDINAPLRDAIACPTDLTDLAPLLIRDIPTYANRVLQRSLGTVPTETVGSPLNQPRPSFILLAGQADAAPLDVTEQVYTTAPDAGDGLEQLFFSTLERTYNRGELTEIVQYHWLFLAPEEQGWRLALMFSAIDNPNDSRPPRSPQESRNGSVGSGVQLWLRDCRAGTIAG